MSHRNPVSVPALLLCALLPILATGCLGQAARTHILTPAIKTGAAYAAQYAHQSPTVDSANVDKFLAAVDEGDSVTVKATWPAVYASAVDGINQRTDVSDGVKVSLREPLVQLDAAIGRLKP